MEDRIRAAAQMQTIYQALVEAELTGVIAEPHQRTPQRSNQRNGAPAAGARHHCG